jgi:hypothetical protein
MLCNENVEHICCHIAVDKSRNVLSNHAYMRNRQIFHNRYSCKKLLLSKNNPQVFSWKDLKKIPMPASVIGGS